MQNNAFDEMMRIIDIQYNKRMTRAAQQLLEEELFPEQHDEDEEKEKAKSHLVPLQRTKRTAERGKKNV